MDKVQIDKVVQILLQISESEDLNDIGQLNQFIGNQEEISTKIENIKNNLEDADIEGLFEEISIAIQSKISEEDLSYFYEKVYSIGRGVDEALGIVGEKKEIAQSIWNKRIEERIQGKDDEEKLKISQEYDNIEIREMVLLHLSDSKKVEVLKDGRRTRNFEKRLIESIKDPRFKIEGIRVSDLPDYEKVDLILNEDENFKIQAVKILEHYYDKQTVLESIKDPKKKIELINEIMYDDPQKDEYVKQCIEEIEDPKERIEIALRELKNDFFKTKFIMEIEDPKERLETALRELKDDVCKSNFVMEIEDPKERIEIALRELKDDVCKTKFIMEIEDSKERIRTALEALKSREQQQKIIRETHIAEGETVELLKKFIGKNDRFFVTINFQDPKIKKEALTIFSGAEYIMIANTLDDRDKLELLENDREENVILIRGIKTPEVVDKLIDKLKLEPKQKECLRRLYQKNNDVLQGIDFRILDDHYVETLGEDKINLMCCYDGITKSVVELSDKGYKFFCKIIEMTTNDEPNEWLSKVDILWAISNTYTELIESIESFDDIDIEKLSKIMLCSLTNSMEIKSAEDVKNYEKIKKEKCDKLIKSGSDDDKKNAVFIKLFGVEKRIVEKFICQFGQDIENIDEPDLKCFIKSLDAIMQVEDQQTLQTIYEECEEVSLMSPTDIKIKLKTAYGKKFNEGLYIPKEEDIIEEEQLPEELRNLGVKVYEAGTDFKMILTSIAAYVYNSPKNFQEDWNRPSLGSQFFCTCYIRNDMRGTAPIPHVCYGISNMADNSLVASGFGDLGSWGGNIQIEINTPEREIYYTPEEQINNTNPYYNEMCFQRFQKGERKQPDYIVAIKKGGKIINSTKIIQAVNDWEGKIPVVIIDEEKCLEAEKCKIDEMMKQYEITKDMELAKKIIQKIENNQKCLGRHIDHGFCYDLEIKLKKDIEEKENNMEALEENYKTVTAQERNEGMSELERIYQKIKEVLRKTKKGEKDGRE